ncbi:hypothetical protein ACFU8Q_38295 [Streptomyces sp. NPDC057543]|uniref:hypothetical protein n=1 Tax=Streptomyces sp. NPDC057543 TaxID=3346163 RepID=UPI0036C549E8
MTSADASLDFHRARAVQSRAGIMLIRHGDHAMLRRSSLWHRMVTGLVADLLRPDERGAGLVAASCAVGTPPFL